jgi:hypothetical protein
MSEVRNALTAAERMRRYRARQQGDAQPESWNAKRKPGPRPRERIATIPASPGRDRDYPLDFASPVQHVTAELEQAGSRGATIDELTATYRHSMPSDLGRVCLFHGTRDEKEARRFLIDRAVSALGSQVKGARRLGAYRLA